MAKKQELCIDGTRVRAMLHPKPNYKFERWSQTAQRWVPIRTNDALHKKIINRDR